MIEGKMAAGDVATPEVITNILTLKTLALNGLYLTQLFNEVKGLRCDGRGENDPLV